MNRIALPTRIDCAIFSLLSCLAFASSAGELPPPIPTAPTLYYACMSTGGRAEYDSAAFSAKNPGPVYRDHAIFHQKMSTAFDEYLAQKYGFHGIVQCGQHKSLAEAKEWLQWRESESRAPGKSYQYVATDWSYAGATAASVPPPTATPAAPAVASRPTSFFACAAVGPDRVAYDSAVFEAPNDAGNARRMMLMYASYLGEKYKVSGMPRCEARPTQAAAQAYLQEFAAGVYGGVSRHVATGWGYNPGATASGAAPSAGTNATSAPAVPKPAVEPKPVASKPATAPPPPSAPAPVAPAPAAAAKSVFVVCYADADPRTRYYNPPVNGGDGNYSTWMESYQKMVREKYRYDRHVRCNKQATLAGAQAYYDTTLSQARAQPSSNGTPSPIVITSWKYP